VRAGAALGNGAGAWIATRLQLKRGERLIRVVFVVAVLIMAGGMFWRRG